MPGAGAAPAGRKQFGGGISSALVPRRNGAEELTAPTTGATLGRRWGDRSIRDMISALTTVPEAVWDQVMPPLGFPTYRCVKRIRAATMAKAGLTPELLDGSPDHVREMLDRSGIVWEWVRGSPVA